MIGDAPNRDRRGVQMAEVQMAEVRAASLETNHPQHTVNLLTSSATACIISFYHTAIGMRPETRLREARVRASLALVCTLKRLIQR